MRTKALWALMVGAVLLGGFAAPLEASSQQDKAIIRAFEDVLDRQPTDRELRRYRDLMYDEHWTERDIRDDLRNRSDYSRNSQRKVQDPDRVVRRAYEDILHREPDADGLRLYGSRMIDQNWSEQDVRAALRKSPEYRQKNAMTREQAEEVVRRAYESVLGREPDAGSRGYVDHVLRDHWSEGDVARELRNSDEYRSKH